VFDGAHVRELKELSARSSGNAIVFIGSRPQSEVVALMRASVATVVCSRVENVSRIPIEAMWSGSPVVAVDLPSSREACGEAPWYYPAGDSLALAEMLRELLMCPDRRLALIEAGFRQIAGRDWTSSTRAVLSALGLGADRVEA
jgi:glycosyltransferase involved in cell wall biosynthesis